jgi:hypothetical protein
VRYVARYVDRIIRPRWFYLTAPVLAPSSPAVCFLLGLIMLPLEYVPLTSSHSGVPGGRLRAGADDPRRAVRDRRARLDPGRHRGLFSW